MGHFPGAPTSPLINPIQGKQNNSHDQIFADTSKSYHTFCLLLYMERILLYLAISIRIVVHCSPAVSCPSPSQLLLPSFHQLLFGRIFFFKVGKLFGLSHNQRFELQASYFIPSCLPYVVFSFNSLQSMCFSPPSTLAYYLFPWNCSPGQNMMK